MEVHEIPIASIKPYEKNPRINADAVEKVAASIREFGFRQPIVVDEKCTIIAGHTRYAAALKLGLDAIPVHVARGLSAAQVKAYRIADNRTAEDSSWNYELLKMEIEDIRGSGFDESLLGFVDLEIERVFGIGSFGSSASPDEVSALRAGQVETRSGDVWVIGDHRIGCGDSGDPVFLKRLLRDTKLDAIVTSPPYGDDARTYDFKPGEFNWLSTMKAVCRAAFDYVSQSGQWLVNLGPIHRDKRLVRYWEPWLDDMESLGLPLFGQYVWDKLYPRPGEYRGRLVPCHEFVFHFCFETRVVNKFIRTKSGGNIHSSSFRRQDGTMRDASSPHLIGQDWKAPDSVIRIQSETLMADIAGGHPAVFPVAFAEFLLASWTAPGEFVFDPFCGSGTTLIAAVNLGRVGFGCEISPRYVDAAVRRLEEATGLKAKRESAA